MGMLFAGAGIFAIGVLFGAMLKTEPKPKTED